MFRLLIFLCFVISSLDAQTPKDLFESGDYLQAKRILTTVNEHERTFADAQYYLGRIATIEKKYSSAMTYFESAVKSNPASAEYHNWLGVLYGVIAMDANAFRQAWLAPKIKSEFEKAAAIDPHNLQTQWGLIYYYSKAPGFLGGSWSKAFECADIITKLDHAQGLSALAFIYENQGDKKKARTFYENSRQLLPGFKETEDGLKRLAAR